jgi:hypothetical protein
MIGSPGNWRGHVGKHARRTNMTEEKTKLDLSKPVQTRSGMPVTIFSTVGREPYPIIGFIGESFEPNSWMKDGTYNHLNTAIDLVNAPTKYSAYINLYSDGTITVHDTYEEACKIAGKQQPRKARVRFVRGVPLEWDAGDPVE